ncbi:hypothetical protein A3860_16725 [Niastella vici]|uniref:Peptidase S8/S53 domain-containing protein n=1 Tax=Niastella vici TaxID=1703345 RepID=A0A1V9G415_9BACT|nr:S8 family peptidase [Niastella vici]OQP65312.1 hypothetical protein A3860_16725 [Niastella vici]
MKQTGLLLLILSLTVQLVQAQPTLTLANRKLSPVLQNNSKLLANKQEQVFWIVASNIDSAKNYFRANNLPVTILQERSGGLLVVRAKGTTLDAQVLSQPFIRFVDVPRQPHEELALSPFDNSLNTINLAHSKYPQLNGSTMVVSVNENKPDTTDIDFRGRYISTPLSSPLISSHATYMSTIIAGGENSFYTSVGVAPAASIISSNFASLLPDADADYRQYNVSVQNHSYGTGIENYYGADAAAYDASTINNPGLLHVFSSGNSGNQTSTGPYAGISNMANITGSFKMAKNIITVGATDSFGNVSFLSSRGPAYDGRVKPELVAFGEDGSSGASAHTSGAVLLMQQYYKEKHNGSLPPASLVKALLVNSAEDKGTKGPDYLWGFGCLNTYEALQELANEQYYSGSLTQGAQQTFSLTVPANTRQLKLTLCWTDPAAAANAPKALINDLDLELVNNGNAQVWQPWVLSPAPVIDSLLLPAVRKKDTLNNVEQITIDYPVAGSYTIRVKGYSIPSGSQAFFTAWQATAADQFQWQLPASVDYVTAGENNLLRWSSTFNTTTGLLEYSIDKGASWQTINNAATLATGTAYWRAPDTCTTALLRMTINGQVFKSDTFTISPIIPVRVGFNCPDSVMISWDRVPGIKKYAVYQLTDKYLQLIAPAADTSFIVSQPGGRLWYTVAPVISNGRYGMKAYTINVTTQGVDCYLKNFLVDLVNNNTASLTAEIGTTYNVKSFTFEKLMPGGYQLLQTFQPGNLAFEYTDNNLADGVNTYRVKIELTNGKAIYSDPQSVYYFLTTRYIVFPNPVHSSGPLMVLMKEESANTYLLLFNSMGQQVLQYQLTQTVESVALPNLQSGIYFMQIKKNGKKEFIGKVMVVR